MIDFSKTTFAELAAILKDGVRIPVICTKGVDVLEDYPEENIRLELVRSVPDSEVTILKVDFSKFDEANKSAETANYFGKRSGAPLITAREAGKYKVQSQLYFDSEALVSEMFELLSEDTLTLSSEYLATGTSVGTYVQWLESLVKASRA